MDIRKHLDFFNPIELKNAIHIIGCGAIGSTLAEMLTRCGCNNIHLYDNDLVSPHNITNQMFSYKYIGEEKTHALYDILTEINPLVELTLHDIYIKQPLAGHVFLAVDNIDTRRNIVKVNKYNPHIKVVYDFRMRLTDAQHYAAEWSNPEQKENFIKSMQFTHEEAKEATPTNACGTSLNISPTVRIITAIGMANFINYTKERQLKSLVLIDAFEFFTEAY